jgi:hypothetical protein
MRMRRALVPSLSFLALALMGAYAVWAFHAAASVGLGWAGLRSAWPYLLAGVLTVEAVIAAFVWLAFFSDRRGHDDRVGRDHR